MTPGLAAGRAFHPDSREEQSEPDPAGLVGVLGRPSP